MAQRGIGAEWRKAAKASSAKHRRREK